jgi:hypothetical protein
MTSPDIKWVTNFGRLCKIFSSRKEESNTVVYNYVFKKDCKDKVDDDTCHELICSEVRMKDCEQELSSCKLVHNFGHFYLTAGSDEIVHANLEKFATEATPEATPEAAPEASCKTIISVFIRKKKSR